jgi:hypothetical protein
MNNERKSIVSLRSSAETVEDLKALADLARDVIARQAKESVYMVATMRDVAEFFGVQEQTVRQWNMRPGGIPGSQGAWPLDQIAKWLTRWREVPEKATEPKPMEAVKQRLAELDLEEREKRLVDVSEITIWMGHMAAIIRDCITQLEQRHGAEAANVVRTPLERLQREVASRATK